MSSSGGGGVILRGQNSGGSQGTAYTDSPATWQGLINWCNNNSVPSSYSTILAHAQDAVNDANS